MKEYWLGGAWPVGTAIAQLGNMTGYKVVTSASKKHHGDPGVVRNIMGSQRFGCGSHTRIDTITENDTPQFSADILSAAGHGNGKLILTLPWSEKYENPEYVEVLKAVAARLGNDGQDVDAWTHGFSMIC
ncbi:hypothetical protein QC760_002581 [Botrytis cinerea]|uniref:Uncharacterized protein n=1 Tax=Botryotinia fuckeliana (strain T4) TaxID=999810 RepID=G2YLC9_BOTF4|nr:hypothetical protein BofuT4_P077200.1 [Botrytis cinerea T4]